MSFWQTQKDMAMQQLVSEASQAGRDVANHWRAQREQKEFDRRARQAYLAALERCKETGDDMPAKFQRTFTQDSYSRQVGVKVVALRELGKTSPQHPLVVSQVCRNAVSTLTLINYNRAGRPDTDVTQYVPDDDKAKILFQRFPK